MPVITLLNGSQRHYNCAVSSIDIAYDINAKIAKETIAGRVNGKLVDASDLIEDNATLILITIKDKENFLKIIRHTCMGLLGHAIKQLWPSAKMVTSLVVDNEFYYDIDLNHTLTQKDINMLEKRMYKLVESNYNIIKKKVSLYEARDIFFARSENYKVDILGKHISHSNKINLYYYEEYIDICNEPCLPNIRFCRYFKLMRSMDIHWHENKNNNKILQRIYGTAWTDKKTLNSYLSHLEEITKRDHRKISKQLDLYHIQEEAPGMIFWHNDGWIIFQELEKFVRSKLKEYHYQEVKGPFMMDRVLWEKTGHWNYYKDLIFTTSSENREYCIKPMNCPGHVQIFNQGLKSYHDLPLRMAEFGSCHRNEASGALHGLMRIRSFTQDDAHIFCTKEQVRNEINDCIHMLYDMYSTFGFQDIIVKLSTRPEKSIGNDEIWNHAEKDLENVLQDNDISFEYKAGEGAFYGPKIEFTLHDCLNRAWQCGTVQLDFSLPKQLGAFYIDKDNKRQIPVMIHRAILGSLERFIGILIEEFAGFFPTWLSPVQVVIVSITCSQSEYAKTIAQKFKNAGIRIKVDLRNEKIGFKIREHTLRRIPYILICGSKEAKMGQVTVRSRKGINYGRMNIDDIINKLKQEIQNRTLKLLEE